MRLGIVTALLAEARSLGLRRPRPGQTQCLGDHLLVRLSGMGPERASLAAQQLLEDGAQALVSFGTAAALQPELRPGTLCLPQEVLWQEQRWPTDESLRGRLMARLPARRRWTVCSRPLLTVAEACVDPQAKEVLGRRFGAAALDMESGAVAAAAAGAQVPWLAVRAIIDPLQRRLPRAALGGVDAFGRLQARVFLGLLSRRPQDLPVLMLLGRDLDTASTSLRLAGEALRKGWSL